MGRFMRNVYTKEIAELQKWVERTNQTLGPPVNNAFLYNATEVQIVGEIIYKLIHYIRDEYPFYASELKGIYQNMFTGNLYSGYKLNPAPFGELFIITKQLAFEPINTQFWTNIHPKVAAVSKDIFCDGHVDSAAEKAIKELESRLRELFQELKPGAGVPLKIGDVIGALISENGIFNFCDTSTISGKDFRRGIHQLFQGTFSAYRNPSAHANIPYSKREAIEQITLISQLMYILDTPQTEMHSEK